MDVLLLAEVSLTGFLVGSRVVEVGRETQWIMGNNVNNCVFGAFEF